MRLALYGLPCAGKTTLLKDVLNFRPVNGSSILNSLSGKNFSELTESEKKETRIKYTEYLKSQSQNIISDGHYSFMENVVFTEEDAEVYDAFLYLHCSPEVLVKRFVLSEKNRCFAKLIPERVREWQDFEIESLRKECHKRNKDFHILTGLSVTKRSVTGSSITQRVFDSFILDLLYGYSPYAKAKSLVDSIRKFYPIPEEIIVSDGDKTIIEQDSFKLFYRRQTEIFDGNFYSGFQSWLFKNFVQHDLSGYNRDALAQVTLNKELCSLIREKDSVVLSSGITSDWEILAKKFKIPHVFADPLICADTKYFTVKLLRELGYKVTAYGDSRNDLYMLQEADTGYLVIRDRISRSLDGTSVSGIRLLYDKSPFVLTQQKDMDNSVLEKVRVCKSDSGIKGGKLAQAHIELGEILGKTIRGVLPRSSTALLILDRGGRFFGDGIHLHLDCALYTYDKRFQKIPKVSQPIVVIADSVISTGKSVLEIVESLKTSNPDVEVVIAVNVINEKAMDLLKNYKIFAVRVSENSYVGKNQASQVGNTGPDTADRLFNLINSDFVSMTK